jgi:hypothetical protein
MGIYEALDLRWGWRGRGFIFLIQGASNVGATLCRGPPAVGVLHVALPL